MNKQNKGKGSRGIEWTDYTWPLWGGCEFACKWEMPDGSIAECYAKSLADRFKMYPLGFEHPIFREEHLLDPLKLVGEWKVFVASMADPLGKWVPDWQIEKFIDVAQRTPNLTYQLLTKNAPRLLKFQFPPNVWLGASVPPSWMLGNRLTLQQQSAMLCRTLDVLAGIETNVTWMSLEPLSWDISMNLAEHGLLDWAVIGAASNGPKTYQPDPEWVSGAIHALRLQGAKIFFKGNLRGNRAAKPWLEEFPERRLTA